MKKIRKLYKQRDEMFKEQTLEIFKIINTSLVCITDFLNDVEPIFRAGHITWEDTNLADDLLIIMGMLRYENDTKLIIDGEPVVITENTKEYFQRVVHMALPYKLVLLNDAEKIKKFLYENFEESKDDTHVETSNELALDASGFDLSKLTEDQREALMHQSTKEKN